MWQTLHLVRRVLLAQTPRKDIIIEVLIIQSFDYTHIKVAMPTLLSSDLEYTIVPDLTKSIQTWHNHL